MTAGCGGSDGPQSPTQQPPTPVPSVIEKVSGDGQNGALGQAVPESLVVRVRDQAGTALAGVAVNWVILSGGGVTSTASATNAAGLSAVTWTVGSVAGENAIEARVANVPPARFTAMGVAGGAGLIAFEATTGPSNETRETDIYVMSPDGTNVRRIVAHTADDGDPAWSPDGSKLAFKSNRDGNYEIYVINVDGTGLTRLTNDPARDQSPRWSPDGTRIAFRHGNNDGEIWVMNADGSKAVRLVPRVANATEAEPDWSPDGTRIVWATTRFGEWEIALINADATGLTRLTTQAGDDYTPAWSSDGTTIAFSTGRFASPNQQFTQDLAVMGPDGSNVRRVTSHPDYEQYPTWSPDGAKLAYNCGRRRRGEITSEVCSVNADGTGELRLTRGFSWASHPAWHR